MTDELTLGDHSALQQAIARTTLAGLVAGLLHWLHPGALADAAALAAVGLAAVPPRSLRSLALVVTLACLGAGALQALPGWHGAVLAAVLGGLMFARDVGGARRLLCAATGGLALAAGGFVAVGLDAATAGLVPPALGWLALGGAAGFVCGFGVVGRELELLPALPAPASELGNEPRALPTDGGEEVSELVLRAQAAGRDVEQLLGGGAPGTAAARDLVRKIARFTERFRELDRQLAATDRAALSARIDRTAERAQASRDEAARGDYLRAEHALRQQLADLDAIRAAGERAVARLHHHVAVLERLRLAGLHRRSADHGQSGAELSPLVEELGAASLDLDSAAEVLAELPSG